MRIRKIALAITAVLCVGNNVVQATIPTSQRNALLQIYNALNGPNWGSSWDGTKDPCNWYAFASSPFLNPRSLSGDADEDNDHSLEIKMTIGLVSYATPR